MQSAFIMGAWFCPSARSRDKFYAMKKSEFVLVLFQINTRNLTTRIRKANKKSCSGFPERLLNLFKARRSPPHPITSSSPAWRLCASLRWRLARRRDAPPARGTASSSRRSGRVCGRISRSRGRRRVRASCPRICMNARTTDTLIATASGLFLTPAAAALADAPARRFQRGINKLRVPALFMRKARRRLIRG